MKIGSFNVRNSYLNNYESVRNDGLSNDQVVSSIIKVEDFDLLGTQELTIDYVDKLAKQLDKYKFYGGYRYGNILRIMPFNENNNIITKRDVISDETVWLPWVPYNIVDLSKAIIHFSLMPRIATIVITSDENDRLLCMINTHLDYQIPSLQVRQLRELKNLIEIYSKKYPVILTGDFNMETKDQQFKAFIKDMSDNNIIRVDIDDKTWHNPKGDDQTLDHIFVSKSFYVDDAGIISSNLTSDHDIVYAKVKIK